jgi:hypothetical protein
LSKDTRLRLIPLANTQRGAFTTPNVLDDTIIEPT